MRIIINPMLHLCKTLISLVLIILWPIFANGATIFSDDFDSCTTNCNATTTTPPNSAAWTQWHTDETSATVGGVKHYSGEISSPGRGGTGKSLKLWRANGVFGNYSGSLVYSGGGVSHWFMRFYIKIPKAFSSSQDYKLWRWNTTGGSGEIYVNYYGNTWSIYDGKGWEALLSSSQYSALRDGNWHCVEFEIGLATSILRFWIDGVLKYEDTGRNWAATGQLSMTQHFPLGNTYDHTGKWQSGWQAMEVDDFVLSTTYVGPGAGAADIPKQPNPPGNILLK